MLKIRKHLIGVNCNIRHNKFQYKESLGGRKKYGFEASFKHSIFFLGGTNFEHKILLGENLQVQKDGIKKHIYDE